MYQIWHDLTRIYILPSLSLIPNNPPINLQVWKLMATFEPKVRWACYDEWRRYIANQVPSRPRVELVVQHQETARATKDLLRRLNKDTSNRTFAIPISTLTLSNPLSVLSIAMSQVLSYSNFVDHLPNVLAYLSPMGFDVLTYLILRALSDPTKEKLKDDGVSLELWLQSEFVFFVLPGHKPHVAFRYYLLYWETPSSTSRHGPSAYFSAYRSSASQ